MSDDTLCAAQVVPQNVEKLPLYHWRPGGRLLVVGSREGGRYDADDAAADQGAFQRRLTVDLLRQAQARAGTEGCCAAWGGSLTDGRRLRLLRQAGGGALVVVTAGFGDADLLAELLPGVDAWLLLHHESPGPLTAAILTGGRHVEMLWRPGERPQVPQWQSP
ncbi:MAG: hypothetical protein ACOCXA_07360, partial [Planctomycetota bacterium]